MLKKEKKIICKGKKTEKDISVHNKMQMQKLKNGEGRIRMSVTASMKSGKALHEFSPTHF